jgi:hypothetical protein
MAATLNLNRLVTNFNKLQQQDHEHNRWASHVVPGTYFETSEGQMASIVCVEGNNVYAV